MAKSMNGRSKTWQPTMFEDSSSATSSPGSEDGATRSDSQAGPTIEPSGREVVPVSQLQNCGHLLGEKDKRHLWPVWFPLIEQRRPPIVFGEQVASAAGLQWLDLVCDDLEGKAYAVAPCDLGAPCVGSPDIRQRIYFVAEDACGCWDRDALHRRHGLGKTGYCENKRFADRHSSGLAPRHERGVVGTPETASAWRELERVHAANAWATWQAESGIGVFDDGIPNRLLQGSVRGFGNAIKPAVAQVFIEAYCEARGLQMIHGGSPEGRTP